MKKDKAVREELPFFIIVIVVLIFLYGIALYTNTGLRVMPVVLLFTLLMTVHAVLHWFVTKFLKNPPLTFFYLALQLAIASVIVYITKDLTLIFGLYMALLGEAVGIFRSRRQKIFSIAIVLVLTAIAAILVMRDAKLPIGFLIGLGPGALFVVIYVDLYNRQVEEREKAQSLLEELEAAHRRLAEYAVKVESLTISAERTRMARELHDTLAQGLSGLILQLEAAGAHLKGGNSRRTEQIIQEAMEKARGTLAEARLAIDNLRSENRNTTAFEASIRQEAERFSEATGIRCACSVELEKPVAESVTDHLKKIITESLTNIAKHSGAKSCGLTLSEEGGRLTLKVEDSGSGFDPEAVPEGHYGLLGMKERSRLLHGEIDISSNPGKGTEVSVTIPFEKIPL